jgi:hypothetical protein
MDQIGVGYLSFGKGHGFASRSSKWAGFIADGGYIIGMQARDIDFTGMYSSSNRTGFHTESNGNNNNRGDGFHATANEGYGFYSNNNCAGIKAEGDFTYAGYFLNHPISTYPALYVGHGAGGLEFADFGSEWAWSN